MKSFLIVFFLLPLSAFGQELTISGTMHHSTLEGGCWYLQGDGGKRYELIGDPSVVNPLRVDGEHIVVRATPAKGAASVCMIGEIVRVLQRIDTMRYAIDLPVMTIHIVGTVHRTRSGVWYVKDTDRHEYEFKTAPPDGKRHIGAYINESFRVVVDKKSTRTNKDGVIYVPAREQSPKPRAKMKHYDVR